jgi:ankyrin repeat protein
MTPLHYACSAGSSESIALLLQHDAAIEALDFQGQTPLFHAVLSANEAAVELLLGHGANVDHQCLPDQATPLHLALMQRLPNVCEVLFANCPDVNLLKSEEQSVLHLVAQYGNRNLLRSCLELNPHLRQRDNRGREAAHYAVMNDDVSVPAGLLAAGCVVDAADDDGNTPLLLSCKDGSYDHVAQLLESQADVNHANAESMTPVHYVLQHDETDLLELLIANEADLDAPDAQGKTPLTRALASNDLESAQLLLDQCVDLEPVDNEGEGALHKLLQTPKLLVQLLRTLSRKGCDFRAPNLRGVTSLDLLKQRQDVNVDELLQMLDLDD